MSTVTDQAIASFRRGSSAAWPLWLVCRAEAWVAFACTWAYFRWADDRVDAPGRDPLSVQRFVTEQRGVLAGTREPECAPEEALWVALAHPAHGPALRAAARTMLDALAWDAHRAAAPPPRVELDAQIARIGDAFAGALWACTGAPGEPPAAALLLARAATAAHHVRDLWEDLELGYCNVPLEDLGPEPAPDRLPDWAARRATEVDGWFARGLAELRAPWRTRFVFAALAWRYRLGLPRWAARVAVRPTSPALLAPLEDAP